MTIQREHNPTLEHCFNIKAYFVCGMAVRNENPEGLHPHEQNEIERYNINIFEQYKTKTKINWYKRLITDFNVNNLPHYWINIDIDAEHNDNFSTTLEFTDIYVPTLWPYDITVKLSRNSLNRLKITDYELYTILCDNTGESFEKRYLKWNDV